MAKINNRELAIINKKIAKLCTRESNGDIKEKEYKEESEKLFKRKHELIEEYINKDVVKVEKPTKPTKLGDFWGK